jgi:hypothetical protein
MAGHPRAHRDTGHSTAEQVDDNRESEPSFRRPHSGDVGSPDPLWRRARTTPVV